VTQPPIFAPEAEAVGPLRAVRRHLITGERVEPLSLLLGWEQTLSGAQRSSVDQQVLLLIRNNQEMAAEELSTFEELRERLGELEETRKTAQSELVSISLHQQRLEELERDADDLVRQYAAIVPESLEVIPPEEKHRIYKTLRMKVLVNIEGTVTVEIVSGKVPEPGAGSVSSGELCS